MINFPTCKINLGLQILRKRPDGYHDIETAMLELAFCDVLEMIPGEAPAFSSTGLEIPGTGNLVLDAEREFRKEKPIPNISFHLHKLIPMGGGLGGGSSDAAFALKLLRDQFAPDVSNEKLCEIASRIGSDCAFFIDGGIQFAEGRGEILSPLELLFTGKYVVLVNLGIHVSTKEAYQGVVPDENRTSLWEILHLPMSEWRNNLANDFETGVFKLHPQLADIKEDLYRHGAIYAAMTGSGSTMFGLFESKIEAISWSHEVQYEKYLQL